MPRSGDPVLALLLFALLAFAGTLLHTWRMPDQNAPREAARQQVRALRLTDLALMTEARYTRHPSLADRHTPFQDHPLALEHFPTGSVLGPPPHL